MRFTVTGTTGATFDAADHVTTIHFIYAEVMSRPLPPPPPPVRKRAEPDRRTLGEKLQAVVDDAAATPAERATARSKIARLPAGE